MSELTQSSAVAPQPEPLDDAPRFAAPADVYETRDALILVLEVPSADPESLDVSYEHEVLRVSARVKLPAREGYQLAYAEYREGNYVRAFEVAIPLDVDRAEAVFQDGLLRLTLPKRPEATAKKIAVRTA